jgi:hypothetical protein
MDQTEANGNSSNKTNGSDAAAAAAAEVNHNGNNGSTAKFFKRETSKLDSTPNDTPLKPVASSPKPDPVSSTSNHLAKGFAALANKFNSNGITTPTPNTTTKSHPLSVKVNHNDLFTKYRQSVSNSSVAVAANSVTKQQQQRNIFNTPLVVQSNGGSDQVNHKKSNLIAK